MTERRTSLGHDNHTTAFGSPTYRYRCQPAIGGTEFPTAIVVAAEHSLSPVGGRRYGGAWATTQGTGMAKAESTIGRRIAEQRKLRHLTQHGLAQRAHVSYSTLTKVESGHALASPGVVAAIARALSVQVTMLTGQPYIAELRADHLEELVEPLRAALNFVDLGPSATVQPRALDAIEIDVANACERIMFHGQVGKAAAALPGLLDELAVVTAGGGDGRAWAISAHAYRAAQHVASKWGYRDLAIVALDRMAHAVAAADDPLLVALRLHERAHEAMRSGQHDQGRRLLGIALGTTADAPDSAQRWVMAGQTHLATAINAARDGYVADAEDHLDAAAAIATQTGETTYFWHSFGPINVVAHRVATLIETDRHEDAVAAAGAASIPDTWTPTRVGHFWMDVGASYARLNRTDQALASLQKARTFAPQVTRYHPSARQTVEFMVSSRRRLPETLSSYARWLGM